jgi:hypothetical protein
MGFVKYIVGLLVLMVALDARSCWSVVDKADLADLELDGVYAFSFKDATDCKPVAGAKVMFLNKTLYTDYNGEIKVPIPPDGFDGNIPILVKKSGYIPTLQKVMASVGSYWQNNFLLSREMPLKSARFVLSWASTPKDLDLHLVSDDFHISYRYKSGNTAKAKLDRDATDGFGAETITLNNLNRAKTYRVYIHKYSSSGSLDHNVHFSLYKNNKLDKSITLTDNTSSRCLQIATIQNNQVVYHIEEMAESKCLK